MYFNFKEHRIIIAQVESWKPWYDRAAELQSVPLPYKITVTMISGTKYTNGYQTLPEQLLHLERLDVIFKDNSNVDVPGPRSITIKRKS